MTYTSELIKSVVMDTAQSVAGQEPFAQGCGVLQVQAAWEALRNRQLQDSGTPLVWFDVNVGPGSAKGLYLRELQETLQPLETSIRIQPRFREGPEGEDLDRGSKVDWQVRIRLECDE